MPTKQIPWLVRAFGALLLMGLCAGACACVWLWPVQTLVLVTSALLLNPLAAVALYPGWWRRREPLAQPDRELERRRPVWSALSELYLDTELQPADHARIAAALVGSGYSAEQLEEILYRELHPILVANLLSVAGEWGCFDAAWLEQRILSRAARRGFALVSGMYLVRREWHEIRALVRGA